MRMRIRRGLDLPINGQPRQDIVDAPRVPAVAILGRDYVGLKPTMQVREGDRVRLGQPLFTDKKHPRISVNAPGAGTIREVRRGPRRVLQAIIIDLDTQEDEETFATFADADLAELDPHTVVENLLASGLWTSLRTRPYSHIPDPETRPSAVFVNAMDTNPLAADPEAVLRGRDDDFCAGVAVVSRLTDGPVHVTKAVGAAIPKLDTPRTEVTEFDGPHPAGLVGTHIHFLHPVSASSTVWHLNYQDAVAIGHLFRTGHIDNERVVALAGPPVADPCLLRTRLGACIAHLVQGKLEGEDELRVLSGPIWSGYRAAGWAEYLGRYHLQISVLREGRERELFGWLRPGRKKFSVTNAFISSLARGKRFNFSTSQNGSPRAMVPIGSYERVMPLDVLPTQLLRSIVVKDTDMAQKLGCLELDEEDLALCTFVCPGKYDYGPMLRENLEQIEKEG